MPVIYDVLRIPAVYRLSQMILGAGCEQAIRSRIRSILDQLPPGQRVLDVGCGPVSYLWQVGLDPVGLDLEPAYTKAFAKGGREVVTASADNIPFEDGSFDSVWTLGLLHHLPDPVARMAVGEILRVCRPGGYIVVFDAVLPEPAWRRPFAHALRRLDRGRHMRTQAQLESILPPAEILVLERCTYTYTGLEGLFCALRKGPACGDAPSRGVAGGA
jgi:SAM-dependent methyltransferase